MQVKQTRFAFSRYKTFCIQQFHECLRSSTSQEAYESAITDCSQALKLEVSLKCHFTCCRYHRRVTFLLLSQLRTALCRLFCVARLHQSPDASREGIRAHVKIRRSVVRYTIAACRCFSSNFYVLPSIFTARTPLHSYRSEEDPRTCAGSSRSARRCTFSHFTTSFSHSPNTRFPHTLNGTIV